MASLILSRVFKQSSRRNIREFAHAAPEFVQSPVERTSEPQRVKLDRFLLSFLESSNISSNHTARLVNQYHDNRGRELKADVIPPTSAKRLGIDTDICPVYLVVHTARNGSQIKVCLSSGFKLQVHENQDSLVLTCAHTLEVISFFHVGCASYLCQEIHLSDILNSATTVANTFVIKNDGTGYGVSGIPSSMPRHDLLLVRPEGLSPLHGDSTFPVSLYPAQIGTKVAAHFLTDYKPGLEEEGWMPCFNRLMLRKWVHGEVVGYRDFAGSGAKVCDTTYSRWLLTRCCM